MCGSDDQVQLLTNNLNSQQNEVSKLLEELKNNDPRGFNILNVIISQLKLGKFSIKFIATAVPVIAEPIIIALSPHCIPTYIQPIELII